MDIELELWLEHNGARKRLGRAVVKDIDPADFHPHQGVEVFANAEHYMGVWFWNGWPSPVKLLTQGRLVPAPHDIELVPPDAGMD